MLYLPDQIMRLRANTAGAMTPGFDTVDVIDNPIGAIPVMNLRNSDRVLDEYGSSRGRRPQTAR